jgi:hypothetical protein
MDLITNQEQNDTVKLILQLIYDLLSQGELMLGKILRRKILEKIQNLPEMNMTQTAPWQNQVISTK